MLTTLELLAEALDVDPAYLVQENDVPPRPLPRRRDRLARKVPR